MPTSPDQPLPLLATTHVEHPNGWTVCGMRIGKGNYRVDRSTIVEREPSCGRCQKSRHLKYRRCATTQRSGGCRMNTTVLEVHVVTVTGRLDPTYAFALLEDAEAFAAALGHADYTLSTVPLIPGGGASALIEAERDE
jgi:hypothetical protein